jgi:hypothetical protein
MVLDNNDEEDTRCQLSAVRFLTNNLDGSYKNHWTRTDWATTKHDNDYDNRDFGYDPGVQYTGSALLKFDPPAPPYGDDATYGRYYYVMDCWIPGVQGGTAYPDGMTCNSPADLCSGVVYYEIWED